MNAIDINRVSRKLVDQPDHERQKSRDDTMQLVRRLWWLKLNIVKHCKLVHITAERQLFHRCYELMCISFSHPVIHFAVGRFLVSALPAYLMVPREQTWFYNYVHSSEIHPHETWLWNMHVSEDRKYMKADSCSRFRKRWRIINTCAMCRISQDVASTFLSAKHSGFVLHWMDDSQKNFLKFCYSIAIIMRHRRFLERLTISPERYTSWSVIFAENDLITAQENTLSALLSRKMNTFQMLECTVEFWVTHYATLRRL